ncbi:MAG: monovalent cation/H+ antiporter subunit E [Natrialbaceae archaeon]
MAAEAAVRLVVPVQRSSTLRQTVDYAMGRAIESTADADTDADRDADTDPDVDHDAAADAAVDADVDNGADVNADIDDGADIDAAAEGPGKPTVHFVFMATWRGGDPGTTADREAAEEFLDQIEIWARYACEEAGVAPDTVAVETALIGLEDYLFSPADYAELLTAYAADNGLDRVIVDPEYSLVGHTTLLQPLEFELERADLAVEEAPVERPASRGRLVTPASPARFLALFGTSLLFYQVLGGFAGGIFDLVTGVATALVVAIALSSVSFYRDPTLGDSPMRVVRGLVYVPYLLYEIVVSNLIVARVILDPRLDIDPRMTRVRAFVGSGFPLTTLANSITLTPGTLTVRADDQNLYVHSLVPFAREGLFDGSLERWVRFVFYGREAARFPSPRERGDTEVLQEPTAAVTDGGPAVDAAGSDEEEDE